MATFTIEQVLNNPKMQYNNDNSNPLNIDWSMMFYDDWRTPEYWAQKYPADFVDAFPAMWKHFEYLAENAKSPLAEWEERQASKPDDK